MCAASMPKAKRTVILDGRAFCVQKDLNQNLCAIYGTIGGPGPTHSEICGAAIVGKSISLLPLTIMRAVSGDSPNMFDR